MDIIEDLTYRGLIKDFSNKENVIELLKTPQTIYCGFDPSASSMHIGNFVMISILMRLQKAGHRIIALVGGGTGMIGDPSGKSKERAFLTAEDVKNNTEAIKKQLSKFLDFSTPESGIVVNNYDWFKDIKYIDFLTEYGRYFSVNEMLKRESVKLRLDREQPLSFLEFNYSIFQAYDFVQIHKQYGAVLQFGGADQWGNIVSGVDLGRRLGFELFALTAPPLL